MYHLACITHRSSPHLFVCNCYDYCDFEWQLQADIENLNAFAGVLDTKIGLYRAAATGARKLSTAVKPKAKAKSGAKAKTEPVAPVV